jgi:spore coat-associated protein N
MAKSKKKLASMAVGGAVALGLLVGGGTFALFTDSVSNTNNTFQSGKLKMEGHRHDIPVTGPMFYTESNDNGAMGTGFWAPLDVHTRGMFLGNHGNLDAKLVKIKATPQSQAANEFAKQAMVTVAVVKDKETGEIVDATVLKEINELLSQQFKKALKDKGWLFDDADDARAFQELAAYIRAELLHQTFVLKNVAGQNVEAYIEDLFSQPLSDFISSGGVNVKNRNIQVPVDKTLYMAYTVTLPDHGADNNLLFNKQVNLTFTSEFEQAKNNQ